MGMPLAGPESFSQQQLAYLKRAMGIDETVLWTGEASGVNATMNLSEAYTNFEKLRFVLDEANSAIPYWESYCMTNGTVLYAGFIRTNSGNAEVAVLWSFNSSNSNTTLTIANAIVRTNGGTSSTNNGKVRKIVGIHRIAGGN